MLHVPLDLSISIGHVLLLDAQVYHQHAPRQIFCPSTNTMLPCLALLGSLIVTCAIGLDNQIHVQSLHIVHSPTANFSSTELSVLEDLFNENDGENWEWDQFGIPWNFSSDANPCIDDWQGIKCTLPPPYDTYHVKNLSLPRHALRGLIPNSLGKLCYLQVLDLSGNEMASTIPFSILNLTRLEVLSLSVNYLYGSFPVVGFMLPMLAVLRLHDNFLSGPIFESIINCSRLEVLTLSNNLIVGAIPENLGNALRRLVNLQLSYNQFIKSTIPFSIFNLAGLEVLSLISNNLVGTIPANIGYMLPRITVLELSNNALVGTIPSSIQNLSHLGLLRLSDNALTGRLHSAFNTSVHGQLKQVYLHTNKFTGPLPDSLLGNSHLEVLALDKNCFHGTIPTSLCNNAEIEVLTLGCLSGSCASYPFLSIKSNSFVVFNPVKGSVPSCIFELPKLKQLALLGNALSGRIPKHIAVNADLTDILLSNNLFSGPIPQTLQELKYNVLDLSYNSFDGEFSGSDDTYGGTIDVRYNYLSGRIPSNVQSLYEARLLSGNMFVCNEDRSDLPRTDTARSYYQCGSDDFNKPLYIWISILSVTLVGILSTYRGRYYVEYVDIERVITQARRWLICVRDTKLPYIGEVRRVGNHITIVGVLCGACLVCISAPVFIFLTEFYGTYTYQYAWTVSLVLLAGIVPFSTGTLLLFSTLIIFTVTYARQTNIVHTAHDHVSPTTLHVIIVCTVYFLVNVSFPVIANAYYLGIVVRSPSLQVTMSLYKLVWNSIVSPYLSRWLVYKLSKRRADFFTLELFVALLTNVIIPLLCVMVITPQCFYGVFEPAGVYSFLYFGGKHRWYGYYVDYYFPFRYQYQCSFTYMEYYASAFIYLSIFSAFGIPVYEMTLLFLYTRATPGTYWYYLLRRYLPRILRPLETDPDKIPPRDIFRPYFDATKFFISQLTCLALILSLGVVSPPLAACLAVTMLATSAYTVLKVGRFLTNATEANQPKYIELIDEESRGVVTLQALSRAFWLMLSFSCAFMAPFLFDVLGSTEGLQGAYWVLIVVPLCPLVAYIMVRIWRFVRDKYEPKAFDVNDVNNSVYSGNGTGKAGENDNAVEMSSVVISPLADETCKL